MSCGGLRLIFLVQSQTVLSQEQMRAGTRYGDALDDFLDRWLHGSAFMVEADTRRFSLISSTSPSTSFELMLNSGPLIGFIVAVALLLGVRILAEGIANMNVACLEHLRANGTQNINNCRLATSGVRTCSLIMLLFLLLPQNN